MKKQFYIYVQCRPSGEPFNVGKGQGKRAYDFKHNRNRHFKNIVKKHRAANIIVHVRNCKSEKQAHQHEIWMIAYGRSQGWQLCNQTDGGEGMSGYVHTDKARAKNRIASRTAWASSTYRTRHSIAMKVAYTAPEYHERVSASQKVVWASPEYCAKMSVIRKVGMASPEARAKNSAAQKIAWKSIARHVKMSAAIKAAWARPKHRVKMSAIRKALWKSLEYRELQSTKQKAAWVRRRAA